MNKLHVLSFLVCFSVNAQTVYFEQNFETTDPITNIRNTYDGTNFSETTLREGFSICDFAAKGDAATHSSANLTFDPAQNGTEFLAYNPESDCGGFSGATQITTSFDLSGATTNLFLSFKYIVTTTIPFGQASFSVVIRDGSTNIVGYESFSTFTARDVWTDVEVMLPITANVSNASLQFDIFGGNAVAYDDIKISDQPTLSTTDVTQNIQTFNVYPNPVKGDVLYIQTNAPTTIELFTITGKKVRSATNITEKIDVSQLQAGVYILQLQTQFTKKTIKVIKG